MFKKQLEETLKEIFNVDRVLFKQTDFEGEKGLYCDIKRSKVANPFNNKIVADVSGTISVLGQDIPYLYLKTRIGMHTKLIKDFSFDKFEIYTPISYNGQNFLISSIDFTYFYRGEFNTIRDYIKEIRVNE